MSRTVGIVAHFWGAKNVTLRRENIVIAAASSGFVLGIASDSA